MKLKFKIKKLIRTYKLSKKGNILEKNTRTNTLKAIYFTDYLEVMKFLLKIPDVYRITLYFIRNISNRNVKVYQLRKNKKTAKLNVFWSRNKTT